MSTEIQRVSALLKMSRCDVTMLPDQPLLLVTSFSPVGLSRWACVVVSEDDFASIDEARAFLATVSEKVEFRIHGYVSFISESISQRKSGAAKPGKNYKEIQIADLCKAVIASAKLLSQFEPRRKRFTNSGPIIEVPCQQRIYGHDDAIPLEAESGVAQLISLAQSKNPVFCMVSGGFGTGKTLLLNEVGYQLSLSKNSSLFPVFINLSGTGSAGVKSAVKTAIGNLFNAISDDEVGDLQNILGRNVKVVLLFDSLDEQLELNYVEVGKIIDEIMHYVDKGFFCVVAFRPELFEGNEDIVSIMRKHLSNKYVSFAELSLMPFTNDAVSASFGRVLSGLFSDKRLKDLALRLACRPIWFSIIRRFAREYGGGGSEITALSFVEYLIQRWGKREAEMNRPSIDPSERDAITTALAFCLHSGHGARLLEYGRIHRVELVRLIRNIVQQVQKTDERLGSSYYLKWKQLPPDLTAESLAVSNLLQIDRRGALAFSDNIFLEYYLVRGVLRALRNDSNVASPERALLDVMGMLSMRDLLGAMRFPGGHFPSLFGDLIKRSNPHGFDSVKGLCRHHLAFLRPPTRLPAPSIGALVHDYVTTGNEESRTYQVIPQDHWPHAGNTFTAINLIHLLAAEDQTIRDEDLSYLDLSCNDLSGIRFINCDFTGSNLSKCRLNGVVFERCNLYFTLFEETEGQTEGSFVSCNHKEALFIAIPCFSDLAADVQKRLDELRQPGEQWIAKRNPVVVSENDMYPVRLSRFLADKEPITNRMYKMFVDDNQGYSKNEHAIDIQNPYYLTFFEKMDDRPVVYVSAISAAAYAIWNGKRLPSVAEFYAYTEAFRSISGDIDRSSFRIGDYSNLPLSTNVDVVYPSSVVTEWSLQVDDQVYWSTRARMCVGEPGERIGQFPPFRRCEVRHCEYFILGTSVHPKAGNIKFSKQATWINPDQGFRCVLDYPAAVRRMMDGLRALPISPAKTRRRGQGKAAENRSKKAAGV